jgi:ribosomal protein S12 methylthiotransferase accessory factor YcaO
MPPVPGCALLLPRYRADTRLPVVWAALVTNRETVTSSSRGCNPRNEAHEHASREAATSGLEIGQ